LSGRECGNYVVAGSVIVAGSAESQYAECSDCADCSDCAECGCADGWRCKFAVVLGVPLCLCVLSVASLWGGLVLRK